MKKIIAIICCVLTAWGGLWFALIANVSDHSPYDQGGLSVLAALLFAASILFAGWGQSLNWKGGRKNG